MTLKIISSSSAGNCYLFEAADGTLIVELGVRFEQVKRALDFNLSKVVGALVSHEHGDHAKGMLEAMGMGVNVYASKGTHEAMNTTSNHRAKVLIAELAVQIGSFKVLPFLVNHDAAEPMGFLINHKECGVTLFLTDTYFTDVRFRGLNNILIEANYELAILDKWVAEGKIDPYRRNRLLKSHLSLENCKGVLKANDLSKVNNIVLIHLSDGNSDAKRFRQEIAGVTGKTVHVADAGDIIENFGITPF